MKDYSHCTCTYPRERGYLTIERTHKQKYHYPRYIDLCATCQHCINCHSLSHKFKRQQGVKGLCTRGQKGRECAQPIVRESMCKTHYHEKYNGQRPVKRHPLSVSKEERARRVQLSYEWTNKAQTSEYIKEKIQKKDKLTWTEPLF